MKERFKYYQIVLGKGKEKYSFTYELFDHRPAQTWAKITSQINPKFLRPDLDPWRGINKDWNAKVKELRSVLKEINLWFPKKIRISKKISIQESLNKLHVHFPDNKDIDNPFRQKQLTRFNDLIHEIEQMYANQILKDEFFYILLCADNFDMFDLEETDYKHFDPNIEFGDLTLHYCHVGRHPYELFIRNDINCPTEHILPQSKISCFHALRFFDNKFDMNRWKNFYKNNNINWPYQINDPKLALGYIKLGKLLHVDGLKRDKDYIYQKARYCNKILHWKFFNDLDLQKSASYETT